MRYRLENALSITKLGFEELDGYTLRFDNTPDFTIIGKGNAGIIQAIARAIGDLPRERAQDPESAKGTISYGDR